MIRLTPMSRYHSNAKRHASIQGTGSFLQGRQEVAQCSVADLIYMTAQEKSTCRRGVITLWVFFRRALLGPCEVHLLSASCALLDHKSITTSLSNYCLYR